MSFFVELTNIFEENSECKFKGQNCAAPDPAPLVNITDIPITDMPTITDRPPLQTLKTNY